MRHMTGLVWVITTAFAVVVFGSEGAPVFTQKPVATRDGSLSQTVEWDGNPESPWVMALDPGAKPPGDLVGREPWPAPPR